MKKIAIVQRHVTNYRINFYNLLYQELYKNNIELTLFAGKTGSTKENEYLKSGIEYLDFGKEIKNYSLFKTLYWQNIFFELKKFDLVICEQANSTLLNYPLLLRRKLFNYGPKFAYWGHGKTLEKKSNFLSNSIKKLLTNKADYWFGYTEHTRTILDSLGIPNNKISIVNNSIDCDVIKEERIDNQTSIKDKNQKTVIFCGRLYKNKKLPFIIDGCKIARKTIKNLNLIIIGDGPEKNNILNLTKDKSWITMTGSLYDKEKAKILLKGNMMVLPSHVGLSILDGFAAGLPIIISDFKNHCPEIAYFQNNINGLKTKATTNGFAQGIIYLFENPKILEKMSINAEKTSDQYTVKDMALKFAYGIIKTLNN